MREPGCVWYICKYVVAPTAAHEEGGVGGRGYELMRELASLGHRAVIITSDANHLGPVPEVKGSHLLQSRDGMLVCWLRTKKAPRARSLLRILGWLHFEWRLLRLRKSSLPPPDVVIVSSLSLLTVLNGVWLKWRLGVRLVFEVRDIWPLTLIEAGYSEKNLLIRALGAIERLGYRQADAIVGTMPNLAEHVADVLGEAVPTACIPMGFTSALARRNLRADGASAPGLPQEKFVVGYAGTIGVNNALETYFKAAVSLSHDEAIHFVVLGDGDLLPDYRRRYGHLPNLTFLPKVAKHEVGTILHGCDVLYVSTFRSQVWRYGQSLNKLIDYMLAGRPIIASYSGFPSMIDEARCGSFVPAEDPDALVQEVARYEAMPRDEREAIGRRGQDWLHEHRTYGRLAVEYERVIFEGFDASSTRRTTTPAKGKAPLITPPSSDAP